MEHNPQDTQMVVVHGDGSDMGFHPVDKPCALCAPPIVITDKMVERAAKAIFYANGTFANDTDQSQWIYAQEPVREHYRQEARAALGAAFTDLER